MSEPTTTATVPISDEVAEALADPQVLAWMEAEIQRRFLVEMKRRKDGAA